MRLKGAKHKARSRFSTPDIMRDELGHALVEALYELDVLPDEQDGALLGIYAILDDLRDVIDRTERLDIRRSA